MEFGYISDKKIPCQRINILCRKSLPRLAFPRMTRKYFKKEILKTVLNFLFKKHDQMKLA